MNFKSFLLINFVSISLGFFGGTSNAQQGYNRVPVRQNYDCICPSFKREVCIYGPSGSIITYPNLCAARCTVTRERGKKFEILPRSACNVIPTVKQLGQGIWNWTTHEWIKDANREARIWKKVNRLMVRLVEHSTGGDSEAPPCVCPAIDRPTCAFGPSGNAITYDNLCVMTCEAYQKNTNGIRIGPNNCTVSSNPVTPEDEERELKDWMTFMEHEIKFYRKLDQAMDGFFVKALARI